MQTLRRTLIASLLVLLSACATARPGGGSGPYRDSRVILAEQIHSNPANNTFDLIRSVRPGWLQTRGPVSLRNEGEILVYYDHVRLGGVGMLRSVTTTGVMRLEYLDAPTATMRWGTGHPHGAILISTRR